MSWQKFQDIDVATLVELRGDAKTALKRVLLTGQSHSVSGRTFTQANLKDLTELIGELETAIAVKQGRAQTRQLTNFNLSRR